MAVELERPIFVNREVWEAQLAYLNERFNNLDDKLVLIHDEVKITNGTVRRHESSIVRIWTIGSTAWGLTLAAIAWLKG